MLLNTRQCVTRLFIDARALTIHFSFRFVPEFLDLRGKRRHAAVHLGGSKFRIDLQSGGVFDGLLNLFAAGIKERRRAFEDQITKPSHENGEVGKLPPEEPVFERGLALCSPFLGIKGSGKRDGKHEYAQEALHYAALRRKMLEIIR